jgi:hypothetical protein
MGRIMRCQSNEEGMRVGKEKKKSQCDVLELEPRTARGGC